MKKETMGTSALAEFLTVNIGIEISIQDIRGLTRNRTLSSVDGRKIGSKYKKHYYDPKKSLKSLIGLIEKNRARSNKRMNDE